MAIRRNLTRINLDKIAAVDAPCQEHATVAILKRKPVSATDPKSIAKATFADALEGGMISAAVNEAFYCSFDGLWQRNDAFRQALTDELAAGGDGSKASADYVASVKSLVDSAVSEARDAGASASDTGGIDKALTAAVDKWLDSRKEHIMKITTKAGLTAAIKAFDPKATTATSDAAAIKSAAKELDAEDMLPASGPLAKVAPDHRDEQIAKLGREVAVLKLSPAARKHYDGLDEAGQTAFVAKSTDEQAAEIEKASGADPVVYKCKDGTEIRKSDGAAAAMLAKSNDELAAKVAKLEGDLGGSTIEKRAVEAYPNVAKSVAVDMLKSAAQLGEDTDSGKAVIKSLDTMNKAGGKLFKSLGSTDEGEAGAPGGIAKARGDFDAKVSEIAARDKIGKAAAMPKARAEHPDLFKAAYPDTFEASEASTENAAIAALPES